MRYYLSGEMTVQGMIKEPSMRNCVEEVARY